MARTRSENYADIQLGILANAAASAVCITSDLPVIRTESMPTGDHLLRADSPLQIGCDFSISFT